MHEVAATAAAGESRAEDPFLTATALWVALHGLVLLRADAPQFPWPDQAKLHDALLGRIAFSTTPPRPDLHRGVGKNDRPPSSCNAKRPPSRRGTHQFIAHLSAGHNALWTDSTQVDFDDQPPSAHRLEEEVSAPWSGQTEHLNPVLTA